MNLDNSIKIGEYILRESGIIEYPDGTIVDFKKAQPVEIGIMRENNTWIVSLTTKASIYKLKMRMTENLEIIGLRFNNIKEALLVHNFLCRQIFNIEDIKGSDDK